jgi:hypothetical protein
MYLMHKDTPVVQIDFSKIQYKILRENLVPFEFRGNNIDIFTFWDRIGDRLLSLSRAHAKQIICAFGINQNDKISILKYCRALSVTDHYWIKDENDIATWSDVSLYKKAINKEIIDTALTGRYVKLGKNKRTPELTTQGSYPKCWIQENKNLYLLKSDKTSDFVNTRMEVLTSRILECFNVDYVKYTGQFMELNNKKLYVSKCKNFVTEKYDFVEAQEIYDYCRRQNINYEEYIMNIDKSFSDMIVLDYILLNTDRHLQNYGCLMDEKGKLVRLAPLFDFNLSLVADYFNKNTVAEETLSQTLDNGETIRGLMQRYLPKSNLVFDKNKFIQLYKEMDTYKNILNNVLTRIKKIGL